MTAMTAPGALHLFATNKLNAATGYGRMERGLLQGFRACDVRVPHFTRKPITPKTGTVLVVGNPEVGDEKLPPGQRMVCYTMSESTRVSQEWVDILNARYDAVIVPCPGLVDVYRDSGVSLPVHYVPLGVDYGPPPYTRRVFDPTCFRVLTYSLGDMRKGVDMAMMAFDRVLGRERGATLVVKARDNWDKSWLAGCEDPRIKVVSGETSEGDWHTLLASCHCMIFASYGEGFGLPPREAVLSGMPVIASSWLGLWDSDKWGYPLPVKAMWPCQFDFYEANAEGALWARPDETAIDGYLADIYANYGQALRRAKAGRDYLLNFTWEQTARQILNLI